MPALRGRSGECEQLDQLLERARRGERAVLVIRGEAGVGKTALLRWATERAADLRVMQITGVESEMELPYAALHQLCGRLLGRVDALPEPQQRALDVALGRVAGDPPDRFLVALAVLNLLSAAADEQPLLCCVDDLQWLDEATVQALGFVARRLLAEPMALLFGVRERAVRESLEATEGPEPSGERRLADLPELWLTGLGEADARALLATVIPGRIDERVRDRIVAETHGNPLALLELPRGISASELAGGFGLPGPAALSSSIEDGFRRRIEPLPSATRRLLQLAAADPVGEPLLLWQAAERLGIGRDAAALAAETGLLEIGTHVRFRHPLVRSAAYRSASPGERQELHAALAQTTDPELDPDRRAWHRARAALGPDEDVACDLERSAERAQARGGLAAAAAFLDSAATLTPDPSRRARRLFSAARAMRDAGQLDAALERVSAVEAGAVGERDVAAVEQLRGQIAFDQRRVPEAARLLLSSARRVASFDVAAARATYLEAMGAAMWAGDQRAMLETAEAACAGPPGSGTEDLLLDAVAVRLTDGYVAAAPKLRAALDAVLALQPVVGQLGHWLWITGLRGGGSVALELADADAAHALACRQVQVARDSGALVQLQYSLNFLARTHVIGGDLAAAAAALEEERRIAEATERPVIDYVGMVLAAWRGDEGPASEAVALARQAAEEYGQGRVADIADAAVAVLDNGRGRYEQARDAARRAFERDQISFLVLVAHELAEAASRTGDATLVEAARERLSAYARATPNDWLLGLEARVDALAGAGEERYRESIALLERTRVRGELARSRLLYGEWLRREGRRVDAREQLRPAREAFLAMGMAAFAERARHELLATGEKVRKRRDDTRDELTPQEEQIARLARDGRTNPEIGAELFLSPRTVEWHLKKVFGKLGISSRRELRNVLPEHELAAQS